MFHRDTTVILGVQSLRKIREKKGNTWKTQENKRQQRCSINSIFVLFLSSITQTYLIEDPGNQGSTLRLVTRGRTPLKGKLWAPGCSPQILNGPNASIILFMVGDDLNSPVAKELYNTQIWRWGKTFDMLIFEVRSTFIYQPTRTFLVVTKGFLMEGCLHRS